MVNVISKTCVDTDEVIFVAKDNYYELSKLKKKIKFNFF